MAYAFIHANLLDGTKDMELREDATVIVDDEGRISKVGTSRLKVPEGAQVVDLADKFLLPGLINMHVHFVGAGKPMSSGVAAKLIGLVTSNPLGRAYLIHAIQTNAENELLSGVTTVRGVGDPCWADIRVRDSIDAGKYLGPRMVCSGWGVTPENGHGRGLIAQTCSDIDAARELVREIADHGADLVKLFITGGVFDAEVPGEPGVVRMELDMAKAVVEAAHSLGLSTAAHVESVEGVRIALKAGVDSIEHGAPLEGRMASQFKKNGAGRSSSLTCTISPALPLAMMDAEKSRSSEVVRENAKIVFEGIVECAKKALAAGIPVGLGTDSGTPSVTHYDMWRELVYFNKLVGASPEFTLYSATLGNAELLGLGKETGSIEKGKSADMIVVGSNPLEDLSVLRKVEQVMIRGHLIAHPAPRKMKQLDAELDALMAEL